MSEWTDIGEQLRKAREGKSLDLRDVAHSTRIPLATLEALEESDYSIFPSPTYARSFLTQYSEFLGVDAHEWIDAFETGDVLSNVNDHGYLQSHNEHIGENRQSPEPTQRKSRSKNQNESSQKSGSGGTSILQTLTVFLVTALLIGGGIYAYKKFEPMLKGLANEDSNHLEATDAEDSALPEKLPPTAQKSETPKSETPKSETPKPEIVKNDLPPGVTPATPEKTEGSDKPDKPVITPPKTPGLAPKAIVIDEDEE